MRRTAIAWAGRGAGLLLVAVSAPAEDAVRDELSRIDPPWYDHGADAWRRPSAPAVPESDRDAPHHGWSSALIGWLLVALVAAGLVALVVAVARGIRLPATPASPDRERVARGAAVAALPIADLPGADDPEAALARALAAGDWAAATVWLYALTLLRLDATGVIRLASGKTNRMYQREAAATPDAARPLAAAVAAFERSYFGHQPVDEPAVRSLQQAVRPPAAAGAGA